MQDIEEAHKRITEAIKKQSAETEHANALQNIGDEYAKSLDDVAAKIQKELKDNSMVGIVGCLGLWIKRITSL